MPEARRSPNAAPLPEASILLHIGPPKTGTTSLQAAFDRARDEVLRQGVRYAGGKRHSREAVLAATGAPSLSGSALTAARKEWAAIVREIRDAREPRILFSSERLAHADADHIRTIVGALDPARLHVVATLRPLSRILPAQWQQAVQSGLTQPFDDWLRRTLDAPRDDPRSFWQRHDHGRLVERWRDVVGAERIRAIVLDETDRGRLLRSFEALVGLRTGTLELHRDLSSSLTYPEAETIRALNVAAGDALTGATHRRIVELGATFRMRQRKPAAGARSIVLPAWALPAVAAVSGEIIDRLAALGVAIEGDLERLRVSPEGDGRADNDPICITPEVAAALTMGVLQSSGALPAVRGDGAGKRDGNRAANLAANRAALDRVPLRRLVGVVARRTARAGVARARAVRTRIA